VFEDFVLLLNSAKAESFLEGKYQHQTLRMYSTGDKNAGIDEG
jgi:hypothetical protein